MDHIPVKFEYEGREVKGTHSAVNGAGTSNCTMFHLTVDNYHWGQFWLTEHYGWKIGSNTKDLLGLVDYFERVVVANYTTRVTKMFAMLIKI